MNPSIASVLCATAIAGLLYLDRDRTVRTSRALWIPGIWIALVGSRPVSSWLGVAPSGDMQLDGSPIDAAVIGLLLAAALVVLIARWRRVRTLLSANWPILIYFVYCLISVAWSYHPDVALKRWIKAIGDLAIPLVILTDPQPVAAIRRVVSRVGMVLLPISVLFIRYYGDLGRGYTSDGLPMNTGITTNKNSLGLIVLVVSLMVFWNVRWLFSHKDEHYRGRRLLAQGTLLVLGLWLFWLANSSTCKACFAIGAFLMVALSHPSFRKRPARVHGLCLVLVVAASLALLTGGQAEVASALDRASNMSGRTEIWAAVIPAVPNSIVGAGFESFWISPNVQIFRETMSRLGWYRGLVTGLNEAHNGYIEVYLNLGWIGVCLIVLVLITGYWSAFEAYRRQPALATLFLAYIISAVFYSITEAGFRMLNPSLTFLLLSVLGSTAINVGLVHAESSMFPNSPIPTSGRASVFGDIAESTASRLDSSKLLGNTPIGRCVR